MSDIVPARSTHSRSPIPVILYGIALALGTAALQWFDWLRLVRTVPGEVYVAVVAAGFLLIGLLAGWRLASPRPLPPTGQAGVAAGLGISPRELEVLGAIARGLTTKEIARALDVSPNTIKTHTQRLFAKLPATTRTGATARARDLGLIA